MKVVTKIEGYNYKICVPVNVVKSCIYEYTDTYLKVDKIRAIKALRESCEGMSLRDAKDIIEHQMKELDLY